MERVGVTGDSNSQEAIDARLARIGEDPRYRSLVRDRSRFGWLLSVLVLAVYLGFILLVAFDKTFLARPIGGGVTTIGIPLGIAVILFAIILTGIYVRRANREFDARLGALLEDAA